MKKTLCILSFIFLNLSIFGQSIEATLIELNFQEGSDPSDLIKTKFGFYFTSTDGYSGNFGRELWYSNGTPEGTLRVKDIYPGKNSSGLSSLTVINDILYFTANDGKHGSELWRSNGTESGTYLVKDIRPNNTSTYNQPTNLISYKNKIYFNATDGINGHELWVSDGTDTGTYMVKDINPNGANSSPNNLFIFNNTLYFSADDGSNGKELWKSDGTEAGTLLVKNINNNSNNSIKDNFLVSGNQFFFYANSDNYSSTTNFKGYELWKSDGTESGTTLVKDIRNGKNQSNSELKGIDLNGILIFEANDGSNGNELWRSDGTESGTYLVKNISNSSLSSITINHLFTKLNNEIFFLANDNVHGEELWKSDGTKKGTLILKDINQGNNSTGIDYIHTNKSINKLLFFTSSINSPEKVLWSSDGTKKGTIQISNIETPYNIGREEHFCNFNNVTFFVGENKKNNRELFTTDGTFDGTKLFKDLNYSTSSSPAKLTNVNGKIFFRGSNEQEFGNQLFFSDGAINGTSLIKRIGSNSNIDDLSETVVINNKLFFSAHNNSDGFEPWISDGTEQGTFMVKDIKPNGSSLWNHNAKQKFFSTNTNVFFTANDGIHGFEPWVSDGTEQGTFMLKDINLVGNGTGHEQTGGSSSPSSFTELNGTIYFIAYEPNNSSSNPSIWKTDGTKTGTSKILSHSSIRYLKTLNNKLLISGYSGNFWESDGTVSGTNKVTTIRSFASNTNGITLELNNELYYVANLPDIKNRFGLYKTDGTVNGTKLLYEGLNHLTMDYPTIINLTKCGSNIYFVLKEYYSRNPPELWKTNGIVTEKIDEASGLSNSEFECHKNNLFYTFSDKKIKFIKDRTKEPIALNIKLLNNIEFGIAASIYNLTSSGDNLFFSAIAKKSGRELFVMTPNIGVLNLNDDFNLNNNKQNKFNIFPNPSKDIINIKSLNSFYHIKIFDLNGRFVLQRKLSKPIKSVKIKVDSLMPNIYVVKLKTNTGEYSQKFLKF